MTSSLHLAVADCRCALLIAVGISSRSCLCQQRTHRRRRAESRFVLADHQGFVWFDATNSANKPFGPESSEAFTAFRKGVSSYRRLVS
jgi:hypothetical protein